MSVTAADFDETGPVNPTDWRETYSTLALNMGRSSLAYRIGGSHMWDMWRTIDMMLEPVNPDDNQALHVRFAKGYYRRDAVQ